MSPEQYLGFEREAACKHEYWAGEVFAMAGASRQHNLHRNIASVQQYLLVARSKPLVELYTRQADGTWTFADRRLGDVVVLSAVGCELAVANVYRSVLEPHAS